MFTLNVITLVCLAIFAAELFSVALGLLTKNKADKLEFLRGFKKGRCTVIYVTAIPLYWIGLIYEATGGNVAEAGIVDYVGSFFSSIRYIIDLVVLKYDTGYINELMAVSNLYSFTVYFCFTLVGLNALLFAFSLVGQRLWEYVQRVKAMLSFKEKIFIFGDNEDSRHIYESDKKHKKVIIDKLSPASTEELYMKEMSYINAPTYESGADRVIFSARLHNRPCVAVINTRDDDVNMLICRAIINRLEALPEKGRYKVFPRLKVYVFGDPTYESIYEDIIRSGYGCIQYVNKYQRIAIDLIDKYPLAGFMDESQLNYKTATVKSGVNINMLLIGFGKTNRQIFLTSIANNQFLEAENPTAKANAGGYVASKLKPVNYHIFDKNVEDSRKHLNFNYYRFKNEWRGKSEADYLPLPEQPANEIYHNLDINSCDFYDEVKATVSAGKADANFIVIAYGSDLENIELARRLVEKRLEWGIKNLPIFVRCRTYHKIQESLEDEGVVFIGNEKDVVFSVDNILSDKISAMAKMRNEIYDLEYDITHSGGAVVDKAYIKQNEKNALRKWHSVKSQLERESSLYCCLSIRSKLNLIGLDYKPVSSDEPEITEAEYFAEYAVGDPLDFTYYKASVKGKKIVRYDLDFKKSLRTTLAIHEHARWNSFMISKGMIPSSIEEIKSEQIIDEKSKRLVYTNGRNYRVRRHGNLTTFAGLVEFRKILLKRDGGDEYEKDVIKYDYQILDDVCWLLTKCGYKIVRKKPINVNKY